MSPSTEFSLRSMDELLQRSFSLYGLCSFGPFRHELFSNRASQRLREAFPEEAPARTVIVALFPYLVDDTPSNLSRYARVPDYHTAAGVVLEKVSEDLAQAMPAHRFLPFIDASPLNEVRAAALAGLGCIGDNGLLIHPVYGSWVFIGILITDAAWPLPPTPEISGCLHCGACATACPGGCILRHGEPSQRETCVSHLSQKKGDLSVSEQRLLIDSGMSWGCDCCQEVCPMNRGVTIAPHPCFDSDTHYTPSLTPEALDDLEGKAYAWRGRAVLERNLRLLSPKS